MATAVQRVGGRLAASYIHYPQPAKDELVANKWHSQLTSYRTAVDLEGRLYLECNCTVSQYNGVLPARYPIQRVCV